MPVRARLSAALACLLALAGFGVVGTAAPASAGSTILCTGYTGCARAGMGSAGYARANATMYWRMYSGHNCTNYAAYRMVHSGLPNSRPWTGSGNATNWGSANRSLTNPTPRVGAVAWWAANVPPAGSVGHVAYVERVVSSSEIVVSQDSWGGTFSWARITRSSGRWPSGFVHFHDVALRSTARPALTGTAKVGSRLTATAGGWSPAPGTVRYQWRAGGTPIAGATGSTLLLGRAQQGHAVSVQVTASRTGYPTMTATSAATRAVAPGALSATGRPTVSGTATVDATLTASPGSWSPAPETVTYQWSANGTRIPGATAARLSVAPGLVGKKVTVTVTAAKAGYASVASTSTATAVVAEGEFAISAPVTVVGTPRLGETLRVPSVAVSPATGRATVQWVRGRHLVDRAVGPTYRLGAADLGTHLAARLVVSRPGYRTLTARSPMTGRIMATPRLRVIATPGHGRLRLSVEVTAPGVSAVTGNVRVRSRGRILALVPLRHGRTTTTLTDLPAGGRTVHVRYVGSRPVTTAAVSRRVRIG